MNTNKLILMPIVILLLFTIFNFAYSGSFGNGTTPEIPGDDSDIEAQTYNIWETGIYMFAILITAIAISVLSGVTILGSGLSDTAQTVIANSSIWLGIWFSLSVGAGAILFTGTLAIIFWIILTSIYVIGLGMQITSGGE